MKACSRCDSMRPLEDFNRCAAASDGRQSYCRDCQAGHYTANAERHKQNVRRRRHELNPPSPRIEPDDGLTPPERRRMKAATRARENSRPFEPPTEERRQYLNRYNLAWQQWRREEWIVANGPCQHCGSWNRPEVDHIDRETKVSHCVWSWSDERRLGELAKCQVLCHECHVEKTRQENMVHGTQGRFRKGCRCVLCDTDGRQADVEKRSEKAARRRARMAAKRTA